MYDQRERAQREYQWGLDGARREGHEEGREKGREKGREEGRKKGQMIGTIATLQGLVGEPETAVVELKAMDTIARNQMVVDLQKRLRSRGR